MTSQKNFNAISAFVKTYLKKNPLHPFRDQVTNLLWLYNTGYITEHDLLVFRNDIDAKRNPDSIMKELHNYVETVAAPHYRQ